MRSMLSSLWWLPLGVAVLGIGPLWWQTRRLARELVAVRCSLAGLRRVRPVLEEAKADMALTRRGLEDLPRR